MDPPGGLQAPTPDIQGFDGGTAIQYLKAQFLSGSTSNGNVTVYATTDQTATGLFSVIHHVNVTPYLDSTTATQMPFVSGTTVTTGGSNMTLVNTVALCNSPITYTVAIYGEP